MIDYGEAPGNQPELPGLGARGEELMAQARAWVGEHPGEWEAYMETARHDSVHGNASPNYCLQAVRRRFRVEIPNAYAPCFARIAMECDGGIRFRLAKSMVDGFTTAVLP